jgi:hypothetical protein
MNAWLPCPASALFHHDASRIEAMWHRLHAADAEPFPGRGALLDAWVLYHNGAFDEAANAGLAIGPAGLGVAHKAACIHATYVEPSEAVRLERLLSVAERAQAQQAQTPDDPASWYWQGYALGRYSQGISVAKALARGLGSQVQHALQTTIHLAPRHADAHLALAHFHAEVIDKVGELIGGMVHGARKDAGLALYEKAMALCPDSAIVLCEFANGLVMLGDERAHERSEKLRQRAQAIEPLDAMEHLYLSAARADPDA